ncbi:hypothetical protein EGH21_10255 [Halomicroarcula sp. F13]|uniref:Uncharacterized protein n=1 Tax=Haloarcula rubra TaxID=2487747 RepID=A0AAW4PQA1_9EURY|nr:hypothetical protein [Halomicroarcula rubra]MBX0323411.1 hypothetical protein [Halomicroarcula rubra]
MSLVPSLRDEVGDNLRAVAAYREDTCKILYERPDVQSKPRVIDRIHQELVMEGLGTEHLEDVFDVGRLNCTVHSFEEAMCFHFVRPNISGVFVSIDPDSLLAMREFVDLCKTEPIDSTL